MHLAAGDGEHALRARLPGGVPGDADTADDARRPRRARDRVEPVAHARELRVPIAAQIPANLRHLQRRPGRPHADAAATDKQQYSDGRGHQDPR